MSHHQLNALYCAFSWWWDIDSRIELLLLSLLLYFLPVGVLHWLMYNNTFYHSNYKRYDTLFYDTDTCDHSRLIQALLQLDVDGGFTSQVSDFQTHV
jgi:hypothetical protein